MKSIEIIAIQPILPNQEQSATDVWRTYRNRGDAENRIKELKADFGAESFNLKGFFLQKLHLYFR